MQKIAVTPPYFYQGEAQAIADALCNRGFARVHIRKPGCTSQEMERLVEAVPRNLRPRLSLHDCFDVAVRAGVGGVHLNRRNPVPPQGWNGLVSRSIHSVQEIAEVTEDYAFLSPVFPSISKPGYRALFNPSELSGVLTPKIFALGGVTPQRLPELERMGFAGAAMLTAAWRREFTREQFAMQFITHPTLRFSVEEGAAMALAGGCRWVQLRHKDASIAQLLTEGGRIAELCHKHEALFIIDDHVELVNELGADGVHLGKNDMPVDEARRQLGPSVIIGATANTFADIEAAAKAGADYIGLGPFRFTSTKKNLSPVLGTHGYTDILARCRQAGIELPVVAIGGITDGDIPAILSTGVAGIALSSSVLGAANPAAQAAATLSVILKNLS